MSKRTLATLLLPLLAACPVWAQTTINQTKALAGTVSPGDEPGFPVTLNVPGRYVLTSDLEVPSLQPGVRISADNVTLDLNGFTIRSTYACNRYMGQANITCYRDGQQATGQDGIAGVASNQRASRVRNGTVQGFPGHGIWALNGAVLDDLTVVSNGRSGIALEGVEGASRLSGVRVFRNLGDGAVLKEALVDRSSFSDNGRDGLVLERGTLLDSLVFGNVRYGIAATAPATVRGTTLFGNGLGPSTGDLGSLGGNFNGTAPF